MKIYIIGPFGSGKTTLSKKIAKKYNINCYELDCLVYDDENNHIKRTNDEIYRLFSNILKKDSWIIEDVGRDRFNKGMECADKIYYLNISKLRVYTRVVKRWIRQRIGKEKFNYPPTLWQFYDMIKAARKSLKNQKEKIGKLKKYEDKVIFLTNKDINKF